MMMLTNQLLQRAGLSQKWAETIMSIVLKVSRIVQPDIREEGDNMDIRKYVQIKKVRIPRITSPSALCLLVNYIN